MQGSYSQFSIEPTFVIFEFYTINQWLDIVLFIIFELAGVLCLIRSKRIIKDSFLSSIFILLLFSFASALLINVGTSTIGNQYLIIPLLLITPFLIVEFLRLNYLKREFTIKNFSYSSVLGVFAGFVSTWGMNRDNEKNYLDPWRVTLFRIIPVTVVILFIVSYV